MSLLAFSASARSFYLLDARTRSVWQFDRGGQFIRRFGYAQSSNAVIRRAFDLHFSTKTGKLYVANLVGTLVFDEDGAYETVIREPNQSQCLAETPQGELLICSSALEGPHWTLLGGDGARHSFYSRRRPLLPPGEEFLAGLVPHSFADTDAAGNIYIGAKAEYQVRKYSSDLNYLGDFPILADEALIPPPERLNAEEAAAWRRGEPPGFSTLNMLSVIEDRFVVIQLSQPGSGYRLHVYSVDGSPAYAPTSWEYYLLGKRNRDSNDGGTPRFKPWQNPEKK